MNRLKMIIDCISDLHGHYPSLEGGDLLIVAGDLTVRGIEKEYDAFWRYLCDQEYSMKIVIAGNHDNYLQKHPNFFEDCKQHEEPIIYLCDSGIEFNGLKIWGSPWTKTFKGMNPNCKAFTCDTEKELAEKWKLIPEDIDILITHSPPWGWLDTAEFSLIHLGSTSLDHVYARDKCPKLWVWGHIHESYGISDSFGFTKVNASHVNEDYEPVNDPIRVTL